MSPEDEKVPGATPEPEASPPEFDEASFNTYLDSDKGKQFLEERLQRLSQSHADRLVEALQRGDGLRKVDPTWARVARTLQEQAQQGVARERERLQQEMWEQMYQQLPPDQQGAMAKTYIDQQRQMGQQRRQATEMGVQHAGVLLAQSIDSYLQEANATTEEREAVRQYASDVWRQTYQATGDMGRATSQAVASVIEVIQESRMPTQQSIEAQIRAQVTEQLKALKVDQLGTSMRGAANPESPSEGSSPGGGDANDVLRRWTEGTASDREMLEAAKALGLNVGARSE